jgi:hypothetical protein
MIPGSNVLNMALRTIARQTVLYQRFVTRGSNAIGQEVSVYDEPGVAVTGSFQPVKRSLYEEYGLDLSKKYANFYVSLDVLPVDRDSSGDQIVYNQELYKVESETEWYPVDGWVALLLIKIDDE